MNGTQTTKNDRNIRRKARAEYIRDAHEFAAERGYSISNSKISRIVSQFLAAHPPRTDFLQYFANEVECQGRIIGYADPTAETAVRNVMRTGGAR